MEYILQQWINDEKQSAEWKNSGFPSHKGTALKLFSDAVFHLGMHNEYRVYDIARNVCIVANTPRGFEVGE